MYFEIETTKINYLIDEDDVLHLVKDREEAKRKVEELKKSLPQHIKLNVICDPDDLYDEVEDALSYKVKWPFEDFEYEIIN